MSPCCVVLSAAGGAYWPITIRYRSLRPFPSIGNGAASHHPVSFLFLLLALSFPLYFPFLSLRLSLRAKTLSKNKDSNLYPLSDLSRVATSFP